MRHLTNTLTLLYGAAGLILVGAANNAEDRHATGWSLLLLACACLFGIAVLHHAHQRDELHAALRQLERAARPPDQPADCCDLWWTSMGSRHERSCPRFRPSSRTERNDHD